MSVIYNRPLGNTTLILQPFESLCYPFNFGSYSEIRAGCGISVMLSTGAYLNAIVSETVINASSSSSFLYFGVKPYSTLMPYQETGLGFIGMMIGATNGDSSIVIRPPGGFPEGGCESTNGTAAYGHILSGNAVNSGVMGGRSFIFNVTQSNLNNGQTSLVGFSFKANSVGTPTQNYTFNEFKYPGSFFNSNLNTMIAQTNGALGGFGGAFTGYLGLNGPATTGAPLTLPNALFIYNPFSTLSLIIEDLIVIKYS